jgi:hypothetical protein
MMVEACSSPAPVCFPPANAYVGSAACQNCHKSEHDRWKRTLMANVVHDPKRRLRAESLVLKEQLRGRRVRLSDAER